MSKIVAEIELKDSKVAAAAKGVRGKIDKEMSPLRRMNIGAGVARGLAVLGAGAIAAGAAVAVGVKSVLDLGGQLSDLSARTGIAADQLMVMGQAFKNNGLSIESVGPAINRLQKALAGANEDGDATASIFDRLGLNMAALSAASPDAQFRAVGSAIAALADPAERTAAAMAIFGKSGGELQALFNSPDALGQAASEVGAQAQIMDRNAALFDDISDKLNLASLKMQGFFVGIADQVAPVLQPLLDWFASQDLAAQGQAFGKTIAATIQMLSDGTIWKAMGLGLQLAGAEFINLLISGINAAIDLLSNVPGFGGIQGVALRGYDTVGMKAQQQALADAAVSKVDAARAAADAKAASEKKAGPGMVELGDKGGGGGAAPSVARMFSTSMGLFVKDPLLAETRRTNTLLERIERGIGNLRQPAMPGDPSGAQLRFT